MFGNGYFAVYVPNTFDKVVYGTVGLTYALFLLQNKYEW